MLTDSMRILKKGRKDLDSSPLVSVIMPVKDGELFIEEAIRSVLRQSFENWELLIVNDSSEDQTLEKVLQFTDSRIRLMTSNGKEGIATALNLGIRESRGDLIARLDCDDIARSDRLERQVEFLREHTNYGLVGSWMRTFGKVNRTVRYPIADEEIRITLNVRPPFGHPAVMFRKLWDYGNCGLYREIPKAEDYDLWLRIAKQWKCANLPRTLTFYRTHANQETKRNKNLEMTEMDRLIAICQRESGLPFLSVRAGIHPAWVWWAAAERVLSSKYPASRNYVLSERRRDLFRRLKQQFAGTTPSKSLPPPR